MLTLEEADYVDNTDGDAHGACDSTPQHMPQTHTLIHTNTPILTTCSFCIWVRSLSHTHSLDAFRQTEGMQCGDRRRPVTSDP